MTPEDNFKLICYVNNHLCPDGNPVFSRAGVEQHFPGHGYDQIRKRWYTLRERCQKDENGNFFPIIPVFETGKKHKESVALRKIWDDAFEKARASHVAGGETETLSPQFNETPRPEQPVLRSMNFPAQPVQVSFTEQDHFQMQTVPYRIKRRCFSEDEDGVLRSLVDEMGTKNWSKIAESMPGRTPKQCRERWSNYLNPALWGPWTTEEDVLLIEMYKKHGTSWKSFKSSFPGKTAVQIKNRVNQISGQGCLRPTEATSPLQHPDDVPANNNTPLNNKDQSMDTLSASLTPSVRVLEVVPGPVWQLPQLPTLGFLTWRQRDDILESNREPSKWSSIFQPDAMHRRPEPVFGLPKLEEMGSALTGNEQPTLESLTVSLTPQIDTLHGTSESI